MPWSANTSKAILHIDCDSFFASVEQALNPELRGKPVVTGKERGIAAAMSVEAKALGIHRAMGLHEIKRNWPQVVILPSDYEAYSLYSQRLFAIMRRFTPQVEEYSIDEAFADLSGLRRVYHGSYEEIALRIKKTAEAELGITVSVGLSSTKSLAKILSRVNKPSGFTGAFGHALAPLLEKMPAGRVCGFGPNSVELLRKHGVLTVADYIRRPEPFAKKLLGKIGVELWYELRGESVYPVASGEPRPHQMTLSKTKTFTPPSSDRDFVHAQLLRNLESAFIKLRRHRLRVSTLGVHLTDQAFGDCSLGAELTRPTASTHEAAPIASMLFESLFKPSVRYRRSGVWLGGLEPEGEAQLDLFEDPCRIKALREISKVIDEANARYGKHTLHLAATPCLPAGRDPLRTFSQHLGDRGDLTERKIQPLKGETFRQHLHVPRWNIKV